MHTLELTKLLNTMGYRSKVTLNYLYILLFKTQMYFTGLIYLHPLLYQIQVWIFYVFPIGAASKIHLNSVYFSFYPCFHHAQATPHYQP